MLNSMAAAGWIFLFFATEVVASAQALPLQIGEIAPPLELGRILQGQHPSAGARKALVIEFWATWCGPCRNTIPHLGELAHQFKDRPIEFVNITDEGIETVTAFLQLNHMPGVVASDPERKMGVVFGIRGLPATVLLDQSGRIAAVTEALKITPSHLEELLTGAPVELPDVRISMPELGQSEPLRNQFPLVHVTITSSIQQMPSAFVGPAWYQGKGVRFPELLSWAYDVPVTRIVMPTSLERLSYDVEASVPPEQWQMLRPLVQAAVTAGSPIRVTYEQRLVDVFVIRGLPGKLKPATHPRLNTKCDPGRINAEAGPISVLQSCLEHLLNRPVVVEGAPDGAFEFDLRWSPGNENQLRTAMEQEFAVRTQLEQRRMQFIVVSRIPYSGQQN
jgi:uncharacterized protein (TIGR03435 family)